MNRLKHIAWIVFLLLSCEEAEEAVVPDFPTGGSVVVSREICLSLQPMQEVGGLSTRTSTQPEQVEAICVDYLNEDMVTRATDKTAGELTINNAFILQFGGTSATSVLKKKQAITAAQLKSGASLTCTFAMTSGVKNRVYVVANCTKTLTEGTTTLGDFEAAVAFSPATAVPNGGLPMSACQDVGVGDAFKPFIVKSLLAKLTFTCQSAGAAIKLKGLPAGYSFYTQTEPGDNKIRPAGMVYSDSGVTLISGTTYYVPENLSGRANLSSSLVRIAQFAPPGAMWIEIGANNTTYAIYLGDGTPQDFNVSGNCAYRMIATILGTSQIDLRVGTPVITALDTNGTANCYIATTTNRWYSFNGTVMGNGAVTSSIIPSVLSPRTSDVLWETWNTTETPRLGSVVHAVCVANDRILFCAGNHLGNAVIAARDTNNTIIWSWHIWRANREPLEQPLAAIGTLTADGELVIMDRNLGAFSATPGDNLSIGLHYQWGRKDPFPGGADLSNATTAMATMPDGIPALSTGGAITSATAVQNPTTFYRVDNFPYDWATRNDELWGTPLTTGVYINGNGFNANKGMKSIYDPCPPGWRVPPGYTFANATRSNGGTFDKGYSFTIGQNNTAVWFPAAGSLNKNGMLSNIGLGAHYWTSTPDEIYMTSGSSFAFDDSHILQSDNGGRVGGYSCRCVKETFAANVPSTPLNLSASGSANCYIVTEPGQYSFDATVMGNGKTTPAHTKGTTSGDDNFPAIVPTKLSPVSAEVLWETFNTTTAPAKGDIVSDVMVMDGKVIFTTGSKEGNAVIAVRNASNDIIWSWHIWRTNNQPVEKPLAAIGNLTTNGEMVLMDRSLGALSATSQDDLSIGLLYQWGRKDPFPGGANLSNATTAIATTPSGVPAVSPGGSVTPTTALRNPTTFYMNSSDWTTRNDNLWGTPLTTRISVNGRDYNFNKGVKSIYDPCPSGWRVPPGYVFANVTTSNDGTFDKGYSFTIGQSNSALWFPAAGSRGYNTGLIKYVGTSAYYWTSASDVNDPIYGIILYFTSGNSNSASGDNRAGGFSIRCCKE